MPRKNDEPTISHLTNTSGYLDLRKTIEGYRFFVKDHYYSDCSGFTATEEQLRQFHRDVGAYLDSSDIEKYKKAYCKIEDVSLTIFEYATDIFDDVKKAERWLLRQSSLTMDEIETKLGQIKYGVVS